MKQVGLNVASDSLMVSAATATRLGNPRASNLVTLGFACGLAVLPFGLLALLDAARAISPAHLRDTNAQALKAGHCHAEERR